MGPPGYTVSGQLNNMKQQAKETVETTADVDDPEEVSEEAPVLVMEASTYVILPFNTEKMRYFRGQSEVGLPSYARFSIRYGRMAKLPRVCHTFATWSNFAIHGPILIILVSKCISKVC